MGTGEQPTNGPATRLWGGRFEGGPADALARLSDSLGLPREAPLFFEEANKEEGKSRGSQ